MQPGADFQGKLRGHRTTWDTCHLPASAPEQHRVLPEPCTARGHTPRHAGPATGPPSLSSCSASEPTPRLPKGPPQPRSPAHTAGQGLQHPGPLGVQRSARLSPLCSDHGLYLLLAQGTRAPGAARRLWRDPEAADEPRNCPWRGAVGVDSNPGTKMGSPDRNLPRFRKVHFTPFFPILNQKLQMQLCRPQAPGGLEVGAESRLPVCAWHPRPPVSRVLPNALHPASEAEAMVQTPPALHFPNTDLLFVAFYFKKREEDTKSTKKNVSEILEGFNQIHCNKLSWGLLLNPTEGGGKAGSSVSS